MAERSTLNFVLSCVRGIKSFASKEKQNCFLARSQLNRPRGKLIMKVHRYSLLFCGVTTLFLADSTGVGDSGNCRGSLFCICKHEIQGTAQLLLVQLQLGEELSKVHASGGTWHLQVLVVKCSEKWWHCVLFTPSTHALIYVFGL